MSQTDNNENTVEKPGTEASADATNGAKEQADSDKLAAPFVGFDEEGRYFVIKIDIRFGYLAIQGWLEEASVWFRAYTKQQHAEQQKRSIVKPKGVMGRFNLFK